MISCEKEVFEDQDFVGTWDIDWKRCDNFHNSFFGNITFNMTDSTENVGSVLEMRADTAFTFFFHFSFINQEQLVIDSLYDPQLSSEWLGTHQITELQSGSFLLERANKSCDNELFKFKK